MRVKHEFSATRSFTVLALLLLVSFFTPNFNNVSLAESPSSVVDIVSCSPSIPVSKNSKIYVERGDVLEFTCKILNSGAVAAEALLIGGRIKDGNPDDVSFASSLVSLPKNGEITSRIVFTPFLQNGVYSHTISLTNSSDGKSIGRQINFVAVLDSPTAKINSIVFDKKSYSINDVVRMTVDFSLPVGGTTTVLFVFDAAAKDESGNTCSYLAINRPILGTHGTYEMRFLEGWNGCDVSSVLVTVKTKEGIPVDEKSVSVSTGWGGLLYDAGWLKSKIAPLVLLVIFPVIIFTLAYIIWRARHRKVVSPANPTELPDNKDEDVKI